MVVHSTSMKRLVLVFAADTTYSMASPILYGIKLMNACTEFLAGIANSDDFDGLEVEVYVVGLNDWSAGNGEYSQPVRLFLNEAESIKIGRPVGYSFKFDKTNTEIWKSHVEFVNEAIKSMAKSTSDWSCSGGDLREEYATGVDFIKSFIERDQEEYDNTKYFVLSITDDAQHGMTRGPAGDTWSKGVSESAVFGKDHEFAYKYACAYAPDKHETLGFQIWKPKSFWKSLNELIALDVTVVWCPIGSSAFHGPNSQFESFVGTMAAIFEQSNSVAISWKPGDNDKRVPETVAHILNTLVTKASICEELDAEKRKEMSTHRFEALMVNAKAHSKITNGENGVLSQIGTGFDDAAKALNQVVIDSELTTQLQNILLGREEPEETAHLNVKVAFRSIKTASNEKTKTSDVDHEIAMAYRSLSATTHPVPSPLLRSVCPIPAPPPSPLGVRVHRASPFTIKEDDDECLGPPVYRSLRACTADADADADKRPVYRSLGGCAVPTADADMAPLSPPPKVARTDTTKSKLRLMRMASSF